MKTLKLSLLVAVTCCLCSCASVYYYQVYKAVPLGETLVKGNSLVYEDENCIVSYNLWDEGGDIGFLIQNKTDKDIFVYLNESYYIANGISHRYFQNRVITKTTNKGISTARSATASSSMTGFNYYNLLQTNRLTLSNMSSVLTSSGYSVSYNEEDVICVPSKTSQVISEFSITQSLIRDCDLLRYPANKRDAKTKTYTQGNTPLRFSNRIVYVVDGDSTPTKFENEFFVSSVTNYNQAQMFEMKYDEFCKEKSAIKTAHDNYAAPDKFYLTYSKTTEPFKH